MLKDLVGFFPQEPICGSGNVIFLYACTIVKEIPCVSQRLVLSIELPKMYGFL